MTKGKLTAILQGELMELPAECPIVIKTSSDYFQIEKIKYDPNVGLGSIMIILGEEKF